MAEGTKMLQFDPEKGRQFKAAYTEACKTKTKDETFIFEGHEFVLGYAKYLIDYLESVFNEGNSSDTGP